MSDSESKDEMTIEEKFRIADDVVERMRRFHLKLQAALAIAALVAGIVGAWVIIRD